jgi:2-keto-4-pentenoate hydratase/2-oxohepta-3-ene-1,7-dioic acid hydratase in catechol pathway
MKLATFTRSTSVPHIGIVHTADQMVFDLTAAASRGGLNARRLLQPFNSMLSLMTAGEGALDAARDLMRRYAGDPEVDVPLHSVQLQAPVPTPASIRDFVTFPGHILGAPKALRSLARKMGLQPAGADPTAQDVPAVYTRQPNFYKGNRFTVVGTGADIRRPRGCSYLDYELEFGVFIGKHGTDVPAGKASSYIFGYSVFNDFSARDIQVLEMGGMTGPCKSKDFSTGNAIGPWIVTADEIADPYSLAMSSSVNGERWCSGTSAQMIHSFEDMIEYVSRDEPLHPGEFFGSGTVGGGTGMEIDRFLQDGDVIEIEVQGLGILRNRITPALDI